MRRFLAPRSSLRSALRLAPVALGLALALVGCAGARSSADGASSPSASASTSRGAGTLYVVGGGPQTPAMVREFVDLAGGPGKARIVVMAMASAAGERSGEAKAKDFRDLGAEARSVWIERQHADADSIVRLLDGATGVWFGGGDQNRLARVLRGSRTLAAIRARYAAGAVVGGTSAGAAVLSTPMITGSERRPGGARPDTTAEWITIERDDVVTEEGFGFLTDVIVDQHFVRRKRQNRLLSLVLERAPHLGAGIDESTALVVHPDGTWSVSGQSVVLVFDARRAAITAAGAGPLGARDVAMHVLPAGSRFDPRTRAVRLPAEAR